MADTRGVVRAERLAVWLLAVLAVAGLGVLAVGPGADLRTATPTVAIEGGYDADTSAVTVTHAGGDTLAGKQTAVVIRVTDVDENATSRFRWHRDGGVSEGETFTIDDPAVDSNGDQNVLDGDGSVGFTFAPGDTVVVLWTGRTLGAPETHTAQLGEFTIPESS